MRFIAMIIMKIILKKAKKDQYNSDHTIVKQAFGHIIESYEDTIMFLDADRTKFFN